MLRGVSESQILATHLWIHAMGILSYNMSRHGDIVLDFGFIFAWLHVSSGGVGLHFHVSAWPPAASDITGSIHIYLRCVAPVIFRLLLSFLVDFPISVRELACDHGRRPSDAQDGSKKYRDGVQCENNMRYLYRSSTRMA